MRSRTILACFGLLAATFLATGAASARAEAAEPGYFRYPDLNGDRIVFAAESDLWIVSDKGGVARRLTTHPGDEHFPQFSPDGRTIAFSGQYDGNVDVFTIPAEGGVPQRLTWHPSTDDVIGWTPDGKYILFRSSRASPNGTARVWRVPAKGGDPEMMPIGWGYRLSIDPASGLWAFNRSSWETSTWKRYRGGEAPQIWVGSPEKADFRKVTDFDGSNAYPMWHGGLIWYLCDRGGTMNIWSMRPDGSEVRRHTEFKDWDARWPNVAPDGRIVFTLAADVHVFDPKDGSEHKIDIQLPGDRVLTRSRYPDAAENLTWLDLTKDGDRLAVTTRGELFSVPVEKGVTLPVTGGSGARESWGSFDAEGKRIVYVTDEPGEQEIRIRDAWGRGEPKVVKPAAKSGWYFPPLISPDGKQVAYADDTQTLWVVPADGGAPVRVDQSLQAPIRSYAWSGDSRWIAYAKTGDNDFGSIHVYDTKDGTAHQVTSSDTDDFSPAWDPDGRYLYFLSHRSTNPLLGNEDWDNIEVKNTRPFMILLRKDVKNPLADLAGLPADEKDTKAKEAKDSKDKDAKDKEAKDEGPKPVGIDFDGLADRVVMLDVPVGNYYGLSATADDVFYVSVPIKGFGEEGGLFEAPKPENTLVFYDLKKKKADTFVDGILDYTLPLGGKKIAVMKSKGEIYVVGTGSAPPNLDDARVDMSDVVIDLDPAEEWAQIYWEAWRNERDFFWAPSMGGLDWKAIGDRYATLLPRLATRSDLMDLIGQLIGELNNSHTYTWGGDPGVRLQYVSIGLLGADVKREGAAYRVERIYHGAPADNDVSPLLAPGVNVGEGEYILALNHRPFDEGRSFYSYFSDLAGKRVVLTVNSTNSTEGSRDVVVEPLPSDHDLRYDDWVRRNREYVAEKSGGKLGYIHLPDMWSHGLIEFNRWFYPQLDKQGMVVDARWNGGGAVSEMIVERLARRLISFGRSRVGGLSTYPYKVLNGPFVVLTNRFAGSDGDIFPAVIQREKLAPVIGTRTWGGVTGINGARQLVDGGMATEPVGSWWEPQGGWTIENHGVDPDIVVENMPQDVARGVDAQLDRGIDETLKLLAEHPPVVPKFGPVRKKTRSAFEDELKGTKK